MAWYIWFHQVFQIKQNIALQTLVTNVQSNTILHHKHSSRMKCPICMRSFIVMYGIHLQSCSWHLFRWILNRKKHDQIQMSQRCTKSTYNCRKSFLCNFMFTKSYSKNTSRTFISQNIVIIKYSFTAHQTIWNNSQ